ncbi:hypothetical protein O3M35_010679 [Rhynocoris fuscipes]|uniref:F-box domain-containing protein n=1 Tax=Rhynocoris fuscipes TaxID=488301 RepID=A0AAW1D7I8_9HEMI
MEDFLGNLPPELSNEILSYFCAEELLIASHVNRKWRSIVMNNEYLWKNICKFYDITDYIPPDNYETPFNDFCNSAKKYLIYEKVLKSNWVRAKNHVLNRLSAVTTENIIFWKRTFVRTYIEGSAVDIFNVDWQCNVNRLQRINTRYILEGRDEVTINETWLTIARLNAISIYKIQPNGEYKLTWIFIVIWDETLPVQYIHVNDETSFEDIDKFIQNYHSNNWIVDCQCILNNKYIWLVALGTAIIISIDENTGKAEVIQRCYAVFPESFCFDKKSVATYINTLGIGVYRPNGEEIYSYKSFHKIEKSTLQQNQSTIAFIQCSPESKVVLINRQNYDIITIGEDNAVTFSLHPTKPMVFILFRHKEFKQISKADGSPWKLRGYSTVNGDLIWSIEKWFKEMPQVPFLTIIHNKFLLMSPLHIGSHKYTLHSCSNGELISITEEENPPVLISDVFKVCKFIEREVFIGVKCYL